MGRLNRVIVSSSNTREDVVEVAMEALVQTLVLLKGWNINKEDPENMLAVIKNLEMQVKGATV